MGETDQTTTTTTTTPTHKHGCSHICFLYPKIKKKIDWGERNHHWREKLPLSQFGIKPFGKSTNKYMPFSNYKPICSKLFSYLWSNCFKGKNGKVGTSLEIYFVRFVGVELRWESNFFFLFLFLFFFHSFFPYDLVSHALMPWITKNNHHRNSQKPNIKTNHHHRC